MKTKDIVLTALFVALMAVSAWIRIPFPAVPLTFQLLVAVASGIFLGPKFGPLSVFIYLIIGFAGLPVFANFSGGFSYIIKPTIGFLISFPLSSFIAGILWKKTLIMKSSSILMGILASYLIGIPYLWLSSSWAYDIPLTFSQSINICWPLILKDIALGIVLFLVALPVTRYLESKETETANL